MTRVARTYGKLMQIAAADPEKGLGGKLFYAGELDPEGRALVVAANVAGAATLAATANREMQKQALRDGVADFLVTTLDEALRILKNELRKRGTVAVCVALAPDAVEREMQERGVAPDLVRGDVSVAPGHVALATPVKDQAEPDLTAIPALVTWCVDSALPKELARLDEIAVQCLDANASAARRWLRLAPRYLGRMAQGLRLLDCDREFAARFVERVREHVERGEFAIGFEIRTHFRGLHDEYRFVPGESHGTS